MTEPNDKDLKVCRLVCWYTDPEPVAYTIAGYREECVKAERERVLVALKTMVRDAGSIDDKDDVYAMIRILEETP